MQARFSMPRQLTDRIGSEEIAEGLDEWKRTPVGSTGPHPELRDEFDIHRESEPIPIGAFEEDLERYLGERLDRVLPALVDLRSGLRPNEVVDALGITDEKLRAYDPRRTIRIDRGDGAPVLVVEEEDGVTRPFFDAEEEMHPWILNHAIALGYLADSLECHERSSGEARYYWKPAGRYLSLNDVNREHFLPEEQPDPLLPDERKLRHTRIEHDMFLSARSRIEEVTLNGGIVFDCVRREIEYGYDSVIGTGIDGLQDLYAEMVDDPEHTDVEAAWVAVREGVVQKETRRRFGELLERPEVRELILSGEPAREVLSDLRLRQGSVVDRIIHCLDLASGDWGHDFDRFREIEDQIDWQGLVTEHRIEGTAVHYFTIGDMECPLFYDPERWDRDELVSRARYAVGDVLAQAAGVWNRDKDFKKAFCRASCYSFPFSPEPEGTMYSNRSVYQLLERIGPERLEAWLDGDARDRQQELADGFGMLRWLGEADRFDDEELLVECLRIGKMAGSGAWRLAQLDISERSEVTRLAELPREERAEIITQGLHVYGIADRLYRLRTGVEPPKDIHWLREIGIKHELDWWLFAYMPRDGDVSELAGLLADNDYLLRRGVRTFDSPREGALEDRVHRLVHLLEEGGSLRSLIFAPDKNEQVDRLLAGEVGDDRDPISRWPEEVRACLSEQEINLALKHANELVGLHDGGIYELAQWRRDQQEQGGRPLPSAVDIQSLEAMVCLALQPKPVRKTMSVAMERIGSKQVLATLKRVIGVRDIQGLSKEWQGFVGWSAHLDALSDREWRAVLGGLRTPEDMTELNDAITKYDPQRDQLRSLGPIRSVRQLQSRVKAIEAAVDPAMIDERLLSAVDAPGFDFAALRRWSRKPEFQHLLAGEYDASQPFRPRRQEVVTHPLPYLVAEALGSPKRNIPGTAWRPKKLYHRLKHLLRESGSALSVPDLAKQVPDELAPQVGAILAEHRIEPREVFTAELHAKSNPEGWVTGNYTDSCMPFGSNRNDEYMFNRGTQFFTVRYRGRTVATSVVVDCMDRKAGKRTILLDNIEVANNYRSLLPQIEQAYLEFWRTYNGRPVRVGARSSDPTLGGELDRGNKMEPVHPVSYLDVRHGSCYRLPEEERTDETAVA